MEAQRQLVADASHELRTPLASLRTNIEVLQRAEGLPAADRADLLRDLVTQTDELTNLVADVVDLSRRGESQADFEDVRLDEVVRAGLERARRLAPQVVFAEQIEPWLVRGNPERLTRLVANLLDNAIKWSPPGATVEVALRDGELIVRDHGPGFAEDDIPLVFDRFYRARRRPGPPRLRPGPRDRPAGRRGPRRPRHRRERRRRRRPPAGHPPRGRGLTRDGVRAAGPGGRRPRRRRRGRGRGRRSRRSLRLPG